MQNLNGFMQFSGVNGVSENEKHKEWFHIDSCSFSIQNELKTPFQNSNHHGHFSSIMVTRTMDEASSQLMACVAGQDVGTCKISFAQSKVDNSDNNDHTLITITLDNAQITSYSTEIVAKGTRLEHISILYSTFHYDYAPISNENKRKPGYSFKCELQD